MKAFGPQIVYDDARLRVIFNPGQSRHLLITFGDAEILADRENFAADAIVRKGNLAALGFMAKAANWYPAGSIAAACREIAPILKAFSTRLLYGSSMGGYAAIKYSRRLGATHVVAYSPQWSIDPLECGDNPSGFEGYFTSSMAGMSIRPVDILGEIYVFFDPAVSADAFHARMIQRQRPAVRAYHVHHAGHNIGPVLRGAALTRGIWDAVLEGAEARIYPLINPVRRKNAFRRQHLLEAAASRHPHLTMRVFASLHRRDALHVLQPLAILMRLCRALVRQGDYATAAAALPMLAPFLSPSRRRVLWYQLQLFQAGQTETPPGLSTGHATSLFYNAFLGVLFHAEPPFKAHDRLGIFPVVATGSDIRFLAVRLGDSYLACSLTDAWPIDLMDVQACDPSDLLRVSGSGTLCVMARDRFLCAEPGGKVAYVCKGQESYQVLREVSEP